MSIRIVQTKYYLSAHFFFLVTKLDSSCSKIDWIFIVMTVCYLENISFYIIFTFFCVLRSIVLRSG